MSWYFTVAALVPYVSSCKYIYYDWRSLSDIAKCPFPSKHLVGIFWKNLFLSSRNSLPKISSLFIILHYISLEFISRLEIYIFLPLQRETCHLIFSGCCLSVWHEQFAEVTSNMELSKWEPISAIFLLHTEIIHCSQAGFFFICVWTSSMDHF